jgi:hypothetical protein
MSEGFERLTFDPPELAPNRVPLGLHEFGLEVGEEGADYGEAAVAVQLARQTVGSTVTDRHLDPVEMSLPLVVMDGADVTLAEGAYRLQQKVGLIQADEYEPAWLMREFSARVGAAGAVGYMIHSAAIHGLQGRPLAYSGVAPNVTLKMLRSPLCYSTEVIESEVFSVEDARALEVVLEEVLGTGPGLFEGLRVTNNGESALRGMIAAFESRDHPQDETKDTTAALTYEAEDLVLTGGSAEAERTGASGKVVRNSALTPGWLTILESGSMTHVGVRRLWVRAYDPTSSAGSVELRAQFRPLGAMRWSETHLTVPTLLSKAFALMDLGEMRPERATLGEQRWEWRIQARAPDGGSATIDIDQVHIAPVEQCAVVRAPEATAGADAQSTKAPGTVANDDSIGTVGWTETGNATASDDSPAVVTFTGAEVSKYLKASTFGFSIPTDAMITGVIVAVEKRWASGLIVDKSVRLVVGGTIQGDDNWKAQKWPTSDTISYYGSSESKWGLASLTPAQVNASNFGAVFSVENLIIEGGGAEVDHIQILVFYLTKNQNRICFAGRSIEFRSDGVFRQHDEDDVWGDLVNEGFNLTAAPSYMEGRAMRGLIIPSTGDLDVLPDTGTHDLEAQVLYRPAFHFSREALGA